MRDAVKAEALIALGAETVNGSLSDTASLDQLCRDCRAIVHAAGAVRGSNQADFDRVNLDGTAALIACLKSREEPPQLLFLSSLAAREPGLSWYAASKRAAEDLLREDSELDWTILRPPPVYGPGDREMLPVFDMMSRGIAPVAGSAEARIALIHVADLVDLIIACLQTGATRHRTLTASDGRPGGYDWHQMAAIAGDVWSRKVRIWRIPRWLLNTVASLNLLQSRLFGRSPMLTPAKTRVGNSCCQLAG